MANPFLRTGLQLVIDLTPEEDILDLLQWRISRLRTKKHAEAQLFRVMANYAPTFGMADTQPLADNASSDGRAKNRRVELILEKPLQQ